MVIWITGLSGSGKTTLSNALLDLIEPNGQGLVSLDGDVVRRVFDDNLGYREKDRVVQISRIQRMAKLLSDQGLIVLVGALYSNANLLEWNRENINPYFEICIKASFETLKNRDTKGLYSGMENVVGVDIPWQEPSNPDLVLYTDYPAPPAELAKQVISLIPDIRTKGEQ